LGYDDGSNIKLYTIQKHLNRYLKHLIVFIDVFLKVAMLK